MGRDRDMDLNQLLELHFDDAMLVGVGRVETPEGNTEPIVDGDGRISERAPVVLVHLESGTVIHADGHEVPLSDGVYAVTSHGLFRQVALDH